MKAYELALDHIEEGILSGRYEVGSILPPERELATQLGIGRSSVREAIRALESQGVLDSAVGAGPASGTRVTSDQSRALTRLLKLHVSLGKYPVDDVVEATMQIGHGAGDPVLCLDLPHRLVELEQGVTEPFLLLVGQVAALEAALDASRSNPSQVTVTASAIVALRGVIESEKRATEDVDTQTGPLGKKQGGGPRQT